jgi:hypothetical protein
MLVFVYCLFIIFVVVALGFKILSNRPYETKNCVYELIILSIIIGILYSINAKYDNNEGYSSMLAYEPAPYISKKGTTDGSCRPKRYP